MTQPLDISKQHNLVEKKTSLQDFEMGHKLGEGAYAVVR